MTIKEAKKSIYDRVVDLGNTMDYGKPRISCIAIAKSDSELIRLRESGYTIVFKPETHDINCYVLVREKSDAEGFLA